MLWRFGQDREDESGPGFASTDETAMASTMARMVVAVTRWRIPLVPRETDELPFPTDRKSLWIFIQHGCSACSCGGSKPVRARLASSTIKSQRYNCQVIRLGVNRDVQDVYGSIITRVNTIFVWLSSTRQQLAYPCATSLPDRGRLAFVDRINVFSLCRRRYHLSSVE